MTIDYPKIREDGTCPFCLGRKDKGLIVCWPCYRRENMRQGESPDQRATLLSREVNLTIRGVR